MPNIPLKDILINARQESYRMRHFFLGVEHIFIALLEVKGGITAGIVKEHGLTPEYVIDAVRRKVGKGSRHRLWAGIPNTPRADVILGVAGDLALENGRKEIEERDLLIAILDEKDSIPTRVLAALGLDIAKLAELAHTFSKVASDPGAQTFVTVDFGPDFKRNESLSKDQLFVLRRMFHGYPSIRVERRLMGGYTPALILVVTPINGDNREDAPVVVKIGQTDMILDEAQRYESHVKSSLPPLTARLEDKPTAPDTSDLAGLKYTLMTDPSRPPQDLRAVAQEWDGKKLGTWLKEQLYPTFGRNWWQQSRPYRFEVWREYDWMMPPLFTLELAPESQITESAHVLKFPIKRARLNEIEYGDMVVVENFTVQKIDREKKIIQLALGTATEAARAYKIEIRGVDFESDTYYRGEVIERMAGTVWKTRGEQLEHAVRALEPDFDLNSEFIKLDGTTIERLPNPLNGYKELLDTFVNGSLSTIHGDMHLGNILIGPNDNPSLIDFAHTRDGHTVFDWATLEISLLNELIFPTLGAGNWEDARTVIRYLAPLTVGDPMPDTHPVTLAAMQSIVSLREVVKECLYNSDNWAEYFVSLGVCALRAVNWETLSVGQRRLMLLVAALALYELRNRVRSGDAGTPSPEETDLSRRPE